MAATPDPLQLGLQLHRAGRLAEAESTYRTFLANSPGSAEGHYLLGTLLIDRGRPRDAITAYRNAIALNPSYADAQNNLAFALLLDGRFEDAGRAAARAVELSPDRPEAHFNLANAMASLGRREDAVNAYRRALALRPRYPEASFNLAALLQDAGRYDEAIALYQRAIEQRPDWPEAHYNIAHALLQTDAIEQAEQAFRRAIELRPSYAEAHNNLGITLRKRMRIDEALACFDRAIALSPEYADAHWNRAGALLLEGDYRNGWPEYEWRWRVPGFPSERRNFAQPQWRGEPLNGRTVLVHAEQGFGDAIQMLRYIPLVARRGAGGVIFEVPPELLRLAQLAGVGVVRARGEALPPFDQHCPIMSLPLAFGTTPQSVPAEVPYLRPDPRDAEAWSRRLASDPARMKVGVVWGGSAANAYNRERSIPLRLLHPLLAVEGASFYSLQKGDAAREARDLPPGVRWTDWTGELRDFADTAALIAGLDMVIGIDTAVTHLAGALGKPVWTMHPFAVEWRWMRERADSPWYPTMRLFRQRTDGDWVPVIREVGLALRAEVARRDRR